MATATPDVNSWQQLLSQTQELVTQVLTGKELGSLTSDHCSDQGAKLTLGESLQQLQPSLLRHASQPVLRRLSLSAPVQDHHNFPRIERNIVQLQQFAESLRSRTNKFRTLDNQIAATRLLAQQGFDASR